MLPKRVLTIAAGLVCLRGNATSGFNLRKLFADAFDVHQLLDLLEPAALLAVFEDALRRGTPDAGQILELFERGR